MMGLPPPDDENIQQADELLQPPEELANEEEEDEEDMNDLMDDVGKLYKAVAGKYNENDDDEIEEYTEEELEWLGQIDREIARQEMNE